MTLVTKRFISGAGGFASTGTLPVAITLTGTVSSSGTGVAGTVVVGTGTQFTKQVVQSDYIYNSVTNELRQVVGIANDNILIIDSAFTTGLSTQALLQCRATYVSVAITATGAGTKDGVAIATGQFLSFNSDSGVAPFAYAGSLTFDVGIVD